MFAKSLLFLLSLQAVQSTWISCNSSDTATDIFHSAQLDGELTGRVVLFTGADGHIATQAILALAGVANATLILACHSLTNCNATRLEIIKAYPKVRMGQIEVLHPCEPPSSPYPGQVTSCHQQVEAVDLSSIASIRLLAESVSKRHKSLHALVNSAGFFGTRMTKDGFVALMEVSDACADCAIHVDCHT